VAAAPADTVDAVRINQGPLWIMLAVLVIVLLAAVFVRLGV